MARSLSRLRPADSKLAISIPSDSGEVFSSLFFVPDPGATVAISPIVAGATIRGPADRMLRELGHEPSVVGIARLYADLARALVIDEADSELAADVRSTGIECVVAPTVMVGPAEATALARVVLDAAERGT